MYIPITKNDEKCAGQLSYEFNIQHKLVDCTHENKNPYGDLDFFNLRYKSIWIIYGEFLANFASIQTFFLRIYFVKLPPITFLSKFVNFV